MIFTQSLTKLNHQPSIGIYFNLMSILVSTDLEATSSPILDRQDLADFLNQEILNRTRLFPNDFNAFIGITRRFLFLSFSFFIQIKKKIKELIFY